MRRKHIGLDHRIVFLSGKSVVSNSYGDIGRWNLRFGPREGLSLCGLCLRLVIPASCVSIVCASDLAEQVEDN